MSWTGIASLTSWSTIVPGNLGNANIRLNLKAVKVQGVVPTVLHQDVPLVVMLHNVENIAKILTVLLVAKAIYVASFVRQIGVPRDVKAMAAVTTVSVKIAHMVAKAIYVASFVRDFGVLMHVKAMAAVTTVWVEIALIIV